MAKKKVVYAKGIDGAIKAAREHLGKRPLFVPPSRRFIPMRHQAFAELLGGKANPGLPTGCFIEVVGNAHAGKTSVTFALINAVINQTKEKIHRIQTDEGVEMVSPPHRVLFMDFEHALDLNYLQGATNGVEVLQTNLEGTKLLNKKTANVWVHQPMTLEEGCDLMLAMIASQEFGLIICDSIAAMLSKEESEKSMGDNTMGKQARAIGMFFRKSTGMVSKYGVTVVLINQWREKIGVVFGDPRTTPGGRATEFYDAIKLDISGQKKTPWFENGKTVKIKSMKNKISGIKTECIYHLEAGTGISAEIELMEMAVAANIITNTGKKRPVKLKTKNGEKKWPTAYAFLDYLRDNPKAFETIKNKCASRGITSTTSLQSEDGW